MQLYPKLILDALTHVRYPGTGKDIVSAEMVEDDIRIDGNRVSFSLVFEKQNDPFAKSVVKAAEQAILTYISENVDIKGNISIKHKQEPKPAEVATLPEVKNIIAVFSGKGGVGKSTVSANLAVSLAKLGYSVGLLDADIHGPSIPKMFGLEDAHPAMEEINGKHYIAPMTAHGVKLLSIGFFVDAENAIVWRGGMASNALKQLITDANWGTLDYFIVDMPPGTSDIHLALVQTLKVSGAVIVTTPPDVALADARKGINMFRNEKINVPILGLVENMAFFTPAELPENRYYIFGKNGGKKLADEMNIPLLGEIPLVQSVRESGDEGTPISCNDENVSASFFMEIARKIISEERK